METAAESSSGNFDTPLGRRLSPVDDLKHRLSLWGESHTQPADSDEEGSEYELLLDPNLPEEYTRPSVPSILSGISDEEKSSKIFTEDGEEEDSPYPEVRAAVRNYDIDAPCNTVSPPASILPKMGCVLTYIIGSCLDDWHAPCHRRCFHEHFVLPSQPLHRSRSAHCPNHRLAYWTWLGKGHARKTIQHFWSEVVAQPWPIQHQGALHHRCHG